VTKFSPKTPWESRYWGSKFELRSQFSRNWWTLVHIFWHCWKALVKYYKPPKYCGPKYKNKKVMMDQILTMTQFSRNWWTLVYRISETVWNFDVKFGILTWQNRKCLQTKFCGPKFRNKEVIKWPNFEFGPNFLKTCELWSRYFGLVVKHSGRNTRHPNIVGQSTKAKKLWVVKFWRSFRFSRNWWTLVHIFRRFWKALGKGYNHQNFVGLRSETK